MEVRVDGRRTWLPQDQVDALRSAPPPRLVRLLPPSDPFLQARDRALLVDGEITGVWRARMTGKAKLEITVTPFDPLPARTRAAIDAEAGHVATARSGGHAALRYCLE